MNARSARLFAVLAIGAAACRTVPVDKSDWTPALVELDVHGSEPSAGGITGIGSPSGLLRRSVPSDRTLTLVASGEDGESGVTMLEIDGVVIRRCQDVDAFGTPTALRLFETRLQLGVSGGPGGGTAAPVTRLANGNLTIGDHELTPCPAAAVHDASGAVRSVERTLIRFCGIRLAARAQNGAGQTGSTGTILLVPGDPASGAFPCPDVPF